DKKGIVLLRKAILDFNPDIIHTHSYRDNFYGRIASKNLARIKRFTTLHLPLSSNFLMPFYKRSFYQFIDNMTNYLVDGFIAVSHDMKKALLRQHIDSRKIRVIQNGLDYKSFEKQGDNSSRLREEWGLKLNQIVIGCIGRLTIQKGQEFLIKACSILKNKYPGIKLILIGNGVLKEQYKKLAIEEGVDLLLLEFRRDIRSCLKAMDVFVLPSIDEGLPITLLEAAEAEIPVVATKVGGVPEFLRDNSDALLIESGNPVKIADAIDFILTHKNQASNMVKSARKRLIEDFSIEKTASKYIDFYKEVLER
ncbi:MAG: glycosyltransferase family 4 protein, partial [Candidatus Coatesbacteria bacterium]|nr:glycosyltransferase family 4 protein [Candidatus Coatesbacteria bacterium]